MFRGVSDQKGAIFLVQAAHLWYMIPSPMGPLSMVLMVSGELRV